jgi:hypothetical protein
VPRRGIVRRARWRELRAHLGVRSLSPRPRLACDSRPQALRFPRPEPPRRPCLGVLHPATSYRGRHTRKTGGPSAAVRCATAVYKEASRLVVRVSLPLSSLATPWLAPGEALPSPRAKPSPKSSPQLSRTLTPPFPDCEHRRRPRATLRNQRSFRGPPCKRVTPIVK